MRLLISLVVFFASANLYAVAPQFWRIATAEELLSGELEGMAVTSSAELKPGPNVEKIASFSDPFVLSQAADRSGTRYFGTGNDGKVYRLRGTELKLLFTASEPEIYAVLHSRGSLYVASSPHGKVYRVDPSSGAGSVFFDPPDAYIWTLAELPDGGFALTTGLEAKLYRVDSGGEGKVVFTAPESHLRSLAVADGGRILVGGSGEGRIYEIDAKGEGRALFDSSMTEISSIYFDPRTKIAWAAGATSVLPTTPPARQQPQQQQQGGQRGDQGTQGGGGGRREGEASASVEVSFSYDEQPSGRQQPPQPVAASEVYRIHHEGYVDIVRRLDREIIYSVTGNEDGSIFLSSGPTGRVYRLRDNQISLIAVLPEKQVVSFSNDRDNVYATTTNTGAVYRIGQQTTSRAEFRAPVKDTDRFSRFGQYAIEGRNLQPARLTMAFRSGNTDTPDATWSSWKTVNGTDGRIDAPAARYLQWKLTVENATPQLTIDSVTISYMNRNVAPGIESVVIHEPGVIFLTGNYPAPPQVVEATNPDEQGIFTAIDNTTERGIPGKRYYRRGFRTISWKAQDVNNDALRYTVSFRRKGETNWLRLRENIEETQVNFDTSQLPDGRYEVRLVASDAPGNPDSPLTDTREGAEFVVDNSAPVITWTAEGADIVIRVTDALSTVTRVEYSADAEKWIRLTPEDGIADSRIETYRLKRATLANRFVVVRAVDAFFNVATASITTN
ncbi:MAG TPA: hypothetical protein VMT00_14625 [Thermoanaerobaculia bacterium]|nr:hypothetical protein [Thermoanaerobaculia bacterium]